MLSEREMKDFGMAVLRRRGCTHVLTSYRDPSNQTQGNTHGPNPEARVVVADYEWKNGRTAMRRVVLFHLRTCRRLQREVV